MSGKEIDATDIIKAKIMTIQADECPKYCGEFEHEVWEKKHDAKIDILEEVLTEIKNRFKE